MLTFGTRGGLITNKCGTDGYEHDRDNGFKHLPRISARVHFPLHTCGLHLLPVIGNSLDAARVVPFFVTESDIELSCNGRTSLTRTLLTRPSSARTSPARTSPARTSPARTSPARTSPARALWARTSPTRTLPTWYGLMTVACRKDGYEVRTRESLGVRISPCLEVLTASLAHRTGQRQNSGARCRKSANSGASRTGRAIRRRDDLSLVRHCHSVGYRRSPGLWLFPRVCSSLLLPDAVVVRFGGQTFGSPVRSSSGYRSMSVVSASLWHSIGTVCSPPRGPVCSPSPGLVSPCVHTYEDQHDEHKDADHKPPIAREADVMGWPAAHSYRGVTEWPDPQSYDTSQMPGVPSTGARPESAPSYLVGAS